MFATYPASVVKVAAAMQQNIDSILDAAEQKEASDVFLQEGEVPRLKVNEQISVFGEEPMSLAQMSAFWQACGANAQSEGDTDRDTNFVSRTQTRYRVSLHRTMGRLGAVMRRIKTGVPSLKALRSAGVAHDPMGRSRARPDSCDRTNRLREVHHHRVATSMD